MDFDDLLEDDEFFDALERFEKRAFDAQLSRVKRGLWRTAMGVEIPLEKLDDDHLLNIIRMHQQGRPPFHTDDADALAAPLVAELKRRDKVAQAPPEPNRFQLLDLDP